MRLTIANLTIAGFGFCCACPLLVMGGVNLRLSDVACLAAALYLLLSVVALRRLHHCAIALAAVLLLSVGWVAVEIHYAGFLDNDPPSTMILLRWLLAIPAAYWLCVLASDTYLRKAALLGLTVGWLADSVLLFADFGVFRSTGHPLFRADSSHVYWVGGTYRAIGLFGHPNGAAIASMYAIPFLVGCAEEWGGLLVASLLGWVVTLGVFYVTRSRGATVAGAVLLLYWAFSRRSSAGAMVLLTLLVGTGAAAAVWPDSFATLLTQNGVAGLLDRFTDTQSLGENSGGRLATASAAIDLAVSHPFGMGSTYPPALDALTGFDATHNALLQLALLGGLPLCLVVTVRLAANAGRLWRGPMRTEQLTSLYFLIVSMFEAHFFNPMTSIICLWLVCGGFIRRSEVTSRDATAAGLADRLAATTGDPFGAMRQVRQQQET